MIYVVALIEYGRVRHRWVYDECRLDAACRQLRTLLECYTEVNESTPVLIKCGQYEFDHLSTRQLLSSMVIYDPTDSEDHDKLSF